MKKLILFLLFTTVIYSQDGTTLHFYYGTNQTTGAEFLFENAGFGFSGAWNVKSSLPSHINDYDKQQTITSEIREEWCSIYVTGYIADVHNVILKIRGGLAVYNDKVTFNDSYTKIDEIVYRPMIGLSAMCPITKDIGIEAGFDTFNYGTIGFTVLF